MLDIATRIDLSRQILDDRLVFILCYFMLRDLETGAEREGNGEQNEEREKKR